jgi:succinate dehydrogenase / fumarate reductase membrane anchor subunit
MAVSASSVGRNGVHDYLLVRVSAIVIAVYSMILTYCFMSTSVMTYEVWMDFFETPWMKVSTLLALLALLIHAWIGTWQVLTDYVKCVWLRGSLQAACVVTLLVYVIWGTMTVWSV